MTLQYNGVAVSCSVLQCAAVCCSVWQCVYNITVQWHGKQCVAVCCGVLQCVAVSDSASTIERCNGTGLWRTSRRHFNVKYLNVKYLNVKRRTSETFNVKFHIEMTSTCASESRAINGLQVDVISMWFQSEISHQFTPVNVVRHFTFKLEMTSTDAQVLTPVWTWNDAQISHQFTPVKVHTFYKSKSFQCDFKVKVHTSLNVKWRTSLNVKWRTS